MSEPLPPARGTPAIAAGIVAGTCRGATRSLPPEQDARPGRALRQQFEELGPQDFPAGLLEHSGLKEEASVKQGQPVGLAALS